MKVKDIIICVVVSILGFLIVYFTNNDQFKLFNDENPRVAYRVYLKGRSIGLIESEEEFNDYFNKKEEEVKKKYNVDSIYIPNDIDIEKDITYDDKLPSPEELYKLISETSPFTIKAYKVVVNRENSTELVNDDNVSDENYDDEVVFYVLNKDLLIDSIKQVVYSFVDSDKYEAFINGKKAGNEVLAPFFNDYLSAVQYQTLDVTDLLKEENEIGIYLGNGWYKGRLGYGGKKEVFGKDFLMIAELHVFYADGREEIIASDETWNYKGSDIGDLLFPLPFRSSQ